MEKQKGDVYTIRIEPEGREGERVTINSVLELQVLRIDFEKRVSLICSPSEKPFKPKTKLGTDGFQYFGCSRSFLNSGTC